NEKRTNSKEKTVVFDDGFEVKSVDNQLVVISPALVENIENNNFKNQFSQLTSIKNKAFNLNPAFIQPSIKQPLSTILENKLSITPSASQFRKGLAVRLAYSPDLSVIFGDKIEKIGRNIGVFAEYRINNRWSVNTGVIRSMKYYDAYPEDYSWIWKMPETPLLEINATCDMLDIPLNIRYDITQNSTSRIFASAGFTSYVMLKEKYKYNYANNYDPSIKWKEWEGSTGAYPFSISNLSVGYERQIFRKVSLQVEPFVKIPLGQVGFGKVRLVTTGVFFSAKYPLTFKK
ncbi:MAG: PorT family protein, partial [Spirosomaceae bacterium]|nr:PorT family protein [Spirosomataceae bacterium]